jgi:hypothetical protein
MYQLTFWLLTLGCLFGGFMAAWSWFAPKFPALNKFHDKIAPFQKWIGLATLLGGILALFYPLGAELIIGDLLPSFAAISVGFVLAVAYIQNKPQFVNNLYNSISPYRVPLGLIAIAAGILHWFFVGTHPFF